MKNYTARQLNEMIGGTLLNGNEENVVCGVSTNSREGNSDTLFVPIIGERVDAHDFIKGAYDQGMRVTLTSRGKIVPETEAMAYIKVENTVDGLQKLGSAVRDSFSTPIVGITGSVGKTTTKEMIAVALETEKCVLKTAGNMNSQVGLPQMMLRLEEKHDIAVIEMGMSMPGEMGRLTAVAKPECAVMTNIGVSHIGQLGSKENIRREKLNIVNAFAEGSVLFVNGDDVLLHQVKECAEKLAQVDDAQLTDTKEYFGVLCTGDTAKALKKTKVVTFGIGEENDYRAEEIVFDENGTEFGLVIRGDKKGVRVKLAVTGEHNVRNALAAIAVAEHYGITPETAMKGLAEYRPIAMRGGKQEVNGIILIDDTYNASPDSMRGGIDSLFVVKANRRIAVLADMLELGAVSKECHEQVGAYVAAKKLDLLIAIGTEANYYVSAANGVESVHFNDNETALEFLKRTAKSGDAILFKGSRGMHLETLVNGMKEK